MEIHNFTFKHKFVKNLKPTDIQIVNVNEHNINFYITQNNEKHYITYFAKDKIEYLIFEEILNNINLWQYSYEIISSNFSTYDFIIKLLIEPSLIDTYLNKSYTLNKLITKIYNKLPEFQKFDNNNSFLSFLEPKNTLLSFKLNLYEYQKKSLGKMIKMENNELTHRIEYTKNIMLFDKNILFNPINNLFSYNKKYLNIKINGGILADEMGLGKTITSIALIDTKPSLKNCNLKYSTKNNSYRLYSKATVILCPSHLSNQWKTEIKKCNPKLKILLILTKTDHLKLTFNDFIINDIIITSHQFLQNFKYYPQINYKYLTASTYNADDRILQLNKYFNESILLNKYKEKTLDECNIDDITFATILQHKNPIFEYFYFHRLILDEGHEIFAEMLANHSLSKYMSEWLNTIDVEYNWYVSGTPFINFNGIINCSKFINLELFDENSNLKITHNEISLENNIFRNFLNKKYIWDNILEKICIRHRKCDVINEVKMFGYKEHIEWIEFTDLERQIYNSKKNKVSSYQLLQLCCHALITDTNKKIFGDIELDLATIQDKLIEHHTNQISVYNKKLLLHNNNNINKPGYGMVKKQYESIISESTFILSMLNKMMNPTLNDSDNECPICMEKITDGNITECGHVFCKDCLKTALNNARKCPTCRNCLKDNQVYSLTKKVNQEVNNENPLIQKYGSKLGKIITMIKSIIFEPDSRIIIFSQIDDMLSLIGKTLQENGIANCFVKGNVYCRNKAIQKFKDGKEFNKKTNNDDENKVIMLSLKNSASGTNLTEATHIFFVEPIDAVKEECKAIESQAIARAIRIGQTKEIKLFRILIKDTIEEIIYNRSYNENTIENTIENNDSDSDSDSDYK